MKIGYYPGCSLHGMAIDFGKSTEATCEALGIELEEIPGWSCCGASAAHSTNHLLGLALPARNLSLAEEAGFRSVAAPCAMCSNSMKKTHELILSDKETAAEVARITRREYRGGVTVLNAIQIFLEYGLDELAKRVVLPLKGLRVACYYGCLLTRPPDLLKFDDAEQPVLMDEVCKAVGTEPVEWGFKTECCGAGFSMSRTDLVCELTRRILENAVNNGAEAVVVACPMCHSNLDMRQANINKMFGTEFNIPIVYVTELVGLAIGVKPKKLGMRKHFVDAMRLTKRLSAEPQEEVARAS
ncbi:MAG: CoB--CoM heterodisulfide reductase iron-sulfur subunit B family protein [bacterium]|nr:CoB--CoM heterodisulfide reductase iron-sulfur subunit B family protein [bacterium]